MREKVDYIYYRFYRFQVSVGNATVAVPFSFLFMIFLTMLNLFSLSYGFYGLFGLQLLSGNGIMVVASVGSILFVLSFFLLIYKKRYKKIIKSYEKETKQEFRRGNFFVIIYIVSTFVMIGIGFYLMILHNRKPA